MNRILALLLTALCVAHPAFAKFEVIARATVPEAFLKEFAEAKIYHNDDILKVEIRELSPDERSAVSASLSEYKAIKPTRTSAYPPLYPYRLRSQGISGSVEALIVVSSDGSVREVYLCSYTNIDFAKAAGLALRMWRFERADHDYVVRVPIPFKLRNVTAVKEFVAWHQKIGVHASWPAYQGSDRRFHHFAVFAFTDWYLFRFARQEIEMKDERPFQNDSAVSFSYYEVDPYDGFRKIEKKESPNPESSVTRSRHMTLVEQARGGPETKPQPAKD